NLRIFPPAINGQTCSRDELIAVGLNDRNPIPLMFQTGYLTIGSYLGDDLYELRFPNREVEKGFYQQLLPLYVPDVRDPFSPFNFILFRKDLSEGRPEDFMKRLAILLKAIPYDDHHESTYRAVTFLIAVLSGTPALAEHHGYKGRSDLEVFTHKFIYVFEFKYDRSVSEAMDQIHERDYAGRYALDPRTGYLIGANFNDSKEERGLEYNIERVKG
ncbi:MAG: PD-(D/E)XK nuclease domain-containing protein, partial [Muribaculaceae bacterium]|nr:PD-(D/E)XK nuclease domain-containing protein [Muribaculaceae bacterium]